MAGHHDHDQIAVDISYLRELANIHLKNLAKDYLDLNKTLAKTSDNEGSVFVACPLSISPTANGAGRDQVYSAWVALRDELVEVFGHSEQHLVSAAKAVNYIATVYEDSDAASAQDVKDAWQDRKKNDAKHHLSPVTEPLGKPTFL